MLKRYAPRLGKRLGLLLFACMFVVALGYAKSAPAVVRVSAGINSHGSYGVYGSYGGGYDLLSEYGEWMRVQPYGVVWCPYVDESWEPFYDGRWIWTSGGWAWDSYEPFGDIVYHYGYWYNEPDIGWFWVPGDEWSPARVEWYTYGDYCGWAPMPPPSFYWPDPWDSHGFNFWIVVNINDFCDDHIGHHEVDQPHYRDVFRRDGVVRRAPDFRRVETVTHREIPVQTIARRPMDIRTDKIKVAERSAARRDVQARGAVSENRGRATTAGRSFGLERKAPVERPSAQAERRIAKPLVIRQQERKAVAPRAGSQPQRQLVAPKPNARPQREVAASRQNARPQREAIASRGNARVERRAEAPARSDQQSQSRTVERRSDRDARTRAEKR